MYLSFTNEILILAFLEDKARYFFLYWCRLILGVLNIRFIIFFLLQYISDFASF